MASTTAVIVLALLVPLAGVAGFCLGYSNARDEFDAWLDYKIAQRERKFKVIK